MCGHRHWRWITFEAGPPVMTFPSFETVNSAWCWQFHGTQGKWILRGFTFPLWNSKAAVLMSLCFNALPQNPSHPSINFMGSPLVHYLNSWKAQPFGRGKMGVLVPIAHSFLQPASSGLSSPPPLFRQPSLLLTSSLFYILRIVYPYLDTKNLPHPKGYLLGRLRNDAIHSAGTKQKWKRCNS